jgi:hypothetical protein
MTTLPLSSIKGALFVASFLICLPKAISQECKKEFKVLVKGKKEYQLKARELDNLLCNNSFDGKYFKIVESTSEDAIKFDNKDELLIRKAANAYYHLSKAREYWVETLKSEYVKDMEQLTIRVDIINSYSSKRHFKNSELKENHNNAWSTPEGETPRFVKDKKKWGKEIWFSPMKRFNARKGLKSVGNNPVYQALKLVEEPVTDLQKAALFFGGLGVIASPATGTTYLNDSIERIGFLAAFHGAIHLSKYLDKAFIEKYYYVETALVPDIIYHEFSHIALSDTMKTVHSVPVIEGVADYFAARISNVQGKELYSKIKDVSTNKSKRLKNKTFYHPVLEESWKATSDFTLSLLWNARKNFEIENKRRAKKNKEVLADFDKLLFQAHFELQENSNIIRDLTRALLNSCYKNCSSKRLGQDVLYRSFEEKGLN